MNTEYCGFWCEIKVNVMHFLLHKEDLRNHNKNDLPQSSIHNSYTQMLCCFECEIKCWIDSILNDNIKLESISGIEPRIQFYYL